MRAGLGAAQKSVGLVLHGAGMGWDANSMCMCVPGCWHCVVALGLDATAAVRMQHGGTALVALDMVVFFLAWYSVTGLTAAALLCRECSRKVCAG